MLKGVHVILSILMLKVSKCYVNHLVVVVVVVVVVCVCVFLCVCVVCMRVRVCTCVLCVCVGGVCGEVCEVGGV